jgi:hypothetical protein
MSSTLVTVALAAIIFLIIASLIVGALRERRRHRRVLTKRSKQTTAPMLPLDEHVTMILRVQDGVVVGAEKPVPSPVPSLPSSWYTRRRTLVSLGFLVMIFLALFVQSGLASGTLNALGKSLNIFSTQNSYSASVNLDAHPLDLTASQRIVRVNSADRDQYYNDYQWQVWSFSSCSGISLEEVMDAYGRHYIAADVLQVEANMGVWSVAEGLMGGEPSMAKVANYFGFKASPNPPRTLQALIATANKGYPVIVGEPGHIFVVRGGDGSHVYVVDSSLNDMTTLTYAQFTALWNGFSVLITPA